METTAAAASTLPDDGKRSRKPASTTAGGSGGGKSHSSSRAGGARKPPAPLGNITGVQPAKNVSALMLREMEELRSLSIGSPVPTPQPDDDEDPFDGAMASAGEDGELFYPAIRVEKCAAISPEAGCSSSSVAGSKCNGSGAAAHGNGASSKDRDYGCAADTKSQRTGNHK